MKNGAPMSAVTIPTWISPGRATTRPMTSAPSSSDRGEHHRPRQDPAVVRSADGPRDVRNGQADEGDRAGRGSRRPAQQHDGERSGGAHEGDPLAEAAGDVVAESEGVQRRCRRQGRGRRRRPGTERRPRRCCRRARRATRPPRTGTGRASRRRGGGPPRSATPASAATAVPARASFNGVDPRFPMS